MAHCPQCHATTDAEWIELQRRSKNGNGNGATVKRWWCRRCERSFGETAGTPYYRSRVSRDGILQAVCLWYYGETTRNIAQALGVNKDTVTRLLDQAAAHPDDIVKGLKAEQRPGVDEPVVDAIREQLQARNRAKDLRRHRVKSRRRRLRSASVEGLGQLALAEMTR